MARPKKKGLDYFPKDVNFYHDQTNRIIYNEYGIYALVLYDFILCYIYEKEGYYMVIDRIFWSIVKDGIGLCKEKAAELLDALIDIEIFDKAVYEKYSVLTSEKIQKIYLLAKRKKSNIINDEYCLISEEQVSDTETGGFCDENPLNKNKENKNKINKNKLNLLHQRKEEESDFIREEDEDKKEDDELTFIINEFKSNIADVTPVIRDDIKKWVSEAGSEFVVKGIRESAKHGAKTWQYVDTLLKNKLDIMIRRGSEKRYEIDSELGF